ncbi:MAG: hypothetical protein HFI70_04015 [Lachnospiraceae bacterium]|nr:hypothetical protein [Lachnospiraceae bacterium]
MVLVFTEEKKKEIEARGMTVVQAKLLLNGFAKVIKPVFDMVWDMCKNMTKEQMKEFLKPDEEES